MRARPTPPAASPRCARSTAGRSRPRSRSTSRSRPRRTGSRVDGWRRMPVGDMAFLSANGLPQHALYRQRRATARSSTSPICSKPSTASRPLPTPRPISPGSRRTPPQLDAETGRLQRRRRRRTFACPASSTTSPPTSSAPPPPSRWRHGARHHASARRRARPACHRRRGRPRAERLATERVAPALQRRPSAHRRARRRRATRPACGRMPDAEDRYAWLVEAATTTKRTPEDIHQAGPGAMQRRSPPRWIPCSALRA